jgi:hypothetical protein
VSDRWTKNYVADWKQALALEGRGFMVQIGTEDAPVASTTSIDDTLVWMLIDVVSGTTAIPFFAQAVIGTWTTATLINYMIEIDNAKVRYSSGGTSFTPLNLRTDAPIASTSAVYVGTDIVTSAKTSSGSLEVYRESMEVNLGDAADYWPKMEYTPSVCPIVIGPASILVHHGSASADTTSYGNMMWFEVPTTSIT